MRKSLQAPLAKFPFTGDPEKEIKSALRALESFSGHERFPLFFGGMVNAEETVIYPLNRGCLLRRDGHTRSLLFLRGRYFTRPGIKSIREAIHITASMALPLVGGVLLHGVGIRRQGIGHLFLGVSGSGKSTLARFSLPEEVISDDGIIVERAGSAFHLAPAPIDQSFSYKGESGRCPHGTAHLAAGFFLKKDTWVHMERQSAADACSIILKNHIHYFRYFTPESVRKTFVLISELCRRTPFYTLHFKEDPSFWPLIEEEISRIT